jgi:TrwC relaxase
MDTSPAPFPLAVHSGHHSSYHRFLLGADPATLAPLPKPSCIGSLSEPLDNLREPLDLARWRKLYNGSFPWREGFGGVHYTLGAVPANHALPRGYERPARRFAAYDTVLIAEPAVSLLALVAGDARIIDGFQSLAVSRGLFLERGAAFRRPETRELVPTGRLVLGIFTEPNNRWLMPMLHAHCRVLNLTSEASQPRRLHCIDAGPLARAAARIGPAWVRGQADLLGQLGYRATVDCDGRLDVQGVSPALAAALATPRCAVLRLLELLIIGDRRPYPGFLESEMPRPILAAMAEQLEAVLGTSLNRYKPAKIDVPATGPWRTAVRAHLRQSGPAALDRLDQEAIRAGARPLAGEVIPCPTEDEAHRHGPDPWTLGAVAQGPCDPELGMDQPRAAEPSEWLAREFAEILWEMNARQRSGLVDPDVTRLSTLARALDAPGEPPSHEGARQAAEFIDDELARRRPPERRPLPSIDAFLEESRGLGLTHGVHLGGLCR